MALGGLRSIRRGSPVPGLCLMAVGAALAHRKRRASDEVAAKTRAKAR